MAEGAEPYDDEYDDEMEVFFNDNRRDVGDEPPMDEPSKISLRRACSVLLDMLVWLISDFLRRCWSKDQGSEVDSVVSSLSTAPRLGELVEAEELKPSIYDQVRDGFELL